MSRHSKSSKFSDRVERFSAAAALIGAMILAGCVGPTDSGAATPKDVAPASPAPSRVVTELAEISRRAPEENPFQGEQLARELRTQVAALPAGSIQQWQAQARLGMAELLLGNETAGIEQLERAFAQVTALRAQGLSEETVNQLRLNLGVGWMRFAETRNCCLRHNADSCVMPIRGGGVHTDREGAMKAAGYFSEVLRNSTPDASLHLKALWLLNIAHMTLGDWPAGVPAAWRLPPDRFRGPADFPRFPNVASALGLDEFSLAGGVGADDYDGDGDIDLIISTMDVHGQLRLFINRSDGTFEDRTTAAGLDGLLGGLNLFHADYDNDGDIDLLVLRGAWMGEQGKHPRSLLRNDGGARFTDVAHEAGLDSVRFPSQAAGWADYDLDGDLDLFIGNEHRGETKAPSQLFRNRGNGTFEDVAAAAGVTNLAFAKAATWGDFDNDRYPDLYVSNLGQPNRLYRNRGDGTFIDVAPQLGVALPIASFPTWFFDVDNDGDLDLFVSSYMSSSYRGASIAPVAAYYLGKPVPDGSLPVLYLGDGLGGFTDATAAWGLDQPTLPMGANFGDLDNDGWLDFYLGTGSPDYESLVPNLMYRNDSGRRFVDVTYAGGFGHLQKGHAIVFADFDNDGDQDIVEQMGGAYTGDKYRDAFYENPGFGNHWIVIGLVGKESNRAGVGARIRVDVLEDGRPRSIYKHVNSGATFGANPHRQSIGLGRASRIDKIEVFWPRTGKTQVITGPPLDRSLTLVEGQDGWTEVPVRAFKLATAGP